eukprot:361186-Chlamydomonas_euryale.AAC.9
MALTGAAWSCAGLHGAMQGCMELHGVAWSNTGPHVLLGAAWGRTWPHGAARGSPGVQRGARACHLPHAMRAPVHVVQRPQV